jgi:hypothetical protein
MAIPTRIVLAEAIGTFVLVSLGPTREADVVDALEDDAARRRP